MVPHAPRARRLAGWVLGLAAALAGCSQNVTVPAEPPSAVRRGDDAFHYQRYSEAIDSYRSYTDQAEHGDYTARAMYKTALAEYRLSRYRATLATLDDLTQRYPNGHWVQVEALRGDAERAQGNTMAALQDWEKAWKFANDKDRQKLRKRIIAAAQDLSDVELARARRLVTDEGYGALLDRQIAARQPQDLAEPIPNAPEESALGADSEVASAPALVEEPVEPVAKAPSAPRKAAALAPVESEPLPPADEGTWSAPPLTAPVPAAPVPPVAAAPAPVPPTPASVALEKKVGRGEGRIGCLLPLSGPARDLGEGAMRGVRLVFGADNSHLVVADTQSDPTVATSQFAELARDPTVLAVIGPVRGEDADVVARNAEESHVPVLLLSAHQGLRGPFALQVGVTRTEQVKGLLDYAMGKIRLRRFGLLYPKDATDVVVAFRKAVQRRGGMIVGAVAYPPGTDDLTAEIQTIRRWRDHENLQAVFLPDDASVASKVADFLQRDMPDVTLLGVQDWEALAAQHNGLNGVLFSDGFYAGSGRPATRTFVNRFEQAYHEAPGAIEADAYDAALFAERALAGGASTPADMLQAFRGLSPLSGAAGDVTVTSQGLLRSGFLLQLSGGRLEEIGEASSSTVRQTTGAQSPLASKPPATAPLPDVEPLSAHGARVPDQPPPAAGGASFPRAATTTGEVPPVTAVGPADGTPTRLRVACLLPLTGPDQVYGKRALAGLRLAFADAPEQLLVRDTGGDPAATVEWLGRLQDEPEVVAVVGPLRSSEAEAAAPIAEREHVPLLLLSQREGLGGRYVLQVAMTRTQQVDLLVHYAVTALKLHHFGIAYPNDGYGSAYAETFKREATKQGASIVGVYSYPPGTSSFAGAVVAVRGWQQTGLDALFIPDAAPTATALAADVRGEVPGLVLLGTESWNDARSLADAGSVIDGAIFADAFFADSVRPSTREFVQQFQQRVGQEPTVFEAQAFDAGLALRKVIVGGATSRDRIVADLTALGTVQGAGELRAASGGFERSVSLLRYRDGKVEEVPLGATES